MDTKETSLLPQRIRTPRGWREGITVPGYLVSLSDDGLPAALSPSAAGKRIIDGGDLYPIYDAARKAHKRGDLAIIVACIAEFLGIISKYLSPGEEEEEEFSWEFEDVPLFWPNFLSYFFEGVKNRKDLSFAEMALVWSLDKRLDELWVSLSMPDPAVYRADWETYSSL